MLKKFLLVSLVFALAFSGLHILSEAKSQDQNAAYRDVLIGFKKFPGNSEKAQVEKAKGKIKYTYHLIPAIAASIPSTAIKGLRHSPNVIYLEEDGDIFLDSELTDSWGVDRIDADMVWDAPHNNKGAGIHVAIIDTGIDRDHPDLVANIAGGVNFVPGKGKNKGVNPDAWDDDHGHGSHCAGIVAADDNGFGVVGVAPDASLYGIKVLDSRGSGKASDFIAGLEWAVDGPDGIQGNSDDAEIVSISLWMSGEGVEDACDAAYAAGVLLVKSAGNNWGGSVTSPGHLDSVLVVSAIDQMDNIAEFSSVGPEVELAAPGVNIYSTYKNGGYTYMDGTSMACPHVSGAAALVWATGYYAGGAGIRLQLDRTAEWLIGLSPDQQGNGLVDAEEAMAYPSPGISLLLNADKSDYHINDTAVLTAVVYDEFGSAVSALPSSAFVTNLYDVDDPNQTPIPRSVFFLETPTPGTYSGELTFTDLGAGGYSETYYRAEVVTTDLRGLSEADDDSFWVVDPSGALSVLIETDKTPPACYAFNDYIYVTVTVKDTNGSLIPGADVHVEYITPSGKYYLSLPDETTDESGKAYFTFRVKKPDGTGDGLIRAWASKAGYSSVLDEMTVCVH